jgi:chromosome segregation ATPase
VSSGVAQLILGIVTVALGGGTVQLVLGLIRRRSELRKTDTESALNQSSVYDKIIERLQEDAATYRDQARAVQTEAEGLKERHRAEVRSLTVQLNEAHVENERLATMIARARTDLDIAQRQVDEMRRYPPRDL